MNIRIIEDCESFEGHILYEGSLIRDVELYEDILEGETCKGEFNSMLGSWIVTFEAKYGVKE